MRHVIPKEILDAVDLQPQYRTFVEIRDHMLEQARQRADVFVRDVCTATKKVVTTPSRANTRTNNSTASKNSTPVPMDVSQMCSDVPKSEAEGHESDSYQYEQDQDCDGDDLCLVKGKSKGGFKGTCSKCGMRGEERETGRKEKGDTKETDGPRESGPVQVTRGTLLGIIQNGTARRMVLRWIRGRLLNLFPISVHPV